MQSISQMKKKRKVVIIFVIGLPVFIFITFFKSPKQSFTIHSKAESDLENFCTNEHALSKPTMVLSTSYLQSLYESKTFDKPNFLHLSKDGVKALAKTTRNICPNNEIFTRQRNLRDTCNYVVDGKIDLSRMVYDDKHKTIMCVVPKNACTTWKRYMWYLIGKVDSKEDAMKIGGSDLLLIGNGTTPVLSRLSREEAMKRLLTYTTFFVARHPFERLLSAYQSKFSLRYGVVTQFMKKTGRTLAKEEAGEHLKGLDYEITSDGFKLIRNAKFERLDKTAQNAALEYISIMNTGNITFPQFVKYILNHKQKRLSVFEYDRHWRPQVALCNPCVMNYNYVIRFEDLAKESNLLLEYLQRNDPDAKKIFFTTDTPNLVDNKQTSTAFSELSKKKIEQLMQIYEKDFITLNYEMY